MSKISDTNKPIFTDLNADESPVTEIESVCMNCYEKGMTRLILTRIPFYKDVILSSFECEHCNYKNNEIQSANKVQEKGVKFNLLVSSQKDLDREIIKSDYANLKIPEIAFEIPELTQKSYLTTIEGILNRTIENIETDLSMKKYEEDVVKRFNEFLDKIRDLKSLKRPFHVVIDDPSGDSFIQNPEAPKKDENLTVTHYKRTPEQNELIGISPDENIDERNRSSREETTAGEIENDEVIQFKDNCPHCNAICDTNMKPTNIPYFKEVIVMSTVCDNCGHRSNEVKSGTGISPKGHKFTLKITDPSDLNRDILKSETASFEIPEIEFFMGEGTLGGKFTTIEGLLKDCREQLGGANPFFSGDSSTSDYVQGMNTFLNKLGEIQNGRMLNVTVILDDPCGNSYLQNVYAPEQDPNMTIEEYERNFEQNETLGLNDIKTENY